MTFDYKAIISRAIKQPFFDTAPIPWAEKLQIHVKPAMVKDGEKYWQAICGYHLPNSGGNPNIYLSAVDEKDRIIHQQTTQTVAVFGWDWEGRRPSERNNPVKGDKQPSEPSANINLGKNQIVTVWVEDSIPSDKVYNLRSDWPDAVFHSATFVAWKLTVAGTEPHPSPIPEPPPKPIPEPPPPGPGPIPDPDSEYREGLRDGLKYVVEQITQALNKL